VVFPRVREARDQTRADRINDPYEHDRYGAGLLLQSHRRCGGHPDKDIRGQRN
jgi:hypothetical protein